MEKFKFTYFNLYKCKDAGIMLSLIPKLEMRNNENFIQFQLHAWGFLLGIIKYK